MKYFLISLFELLFEYGAEFCYESKNGKKLHIKFGNSNKKR